MINTFEPYSNDVYAWAYRLLGRHHETLDVVQDVFLKWTTQCNQSVPDHPKSWLRRVTMNRAIDVIRKNQRSLEHITAIDPTVSLPAPSMDHAEQSELRKDIAMALDRVTDHQRSVLVAKIYDGMTFAQIAEEMKLAVSTVKTHYLRAIRVMRDRLQKSWSDGES